MPHDALNPPDGGCLPAQAVGPEAATLHALLAAWPAAFAAEPHPAGGIRLITPVLLANGDCLTLRYDPATGLLDDDDLLAEELALARPRHPERTAAWRRWEAGLRGTAVTYRREPPQLTAPATPAGLAALIAACLRAEACWR